MNQRLIYFLFIFFTLILNGCVEKRTEKPMLAYQWWLGSTPPAEVEVLKGNYWESSHWSKEYIVYLNLKAPTSWISHFISENNLVTVKTVKVGSANLPAWFEPSATCKIFSKNQQGDNSFYYYDSTAHQLWVYEIQL